MGPDYTITELAEQAGVTPRTVRYYVAQGLLPSPGQVGAGARYSGAHLDRLLLIRQLQEAHQPLAEIRNRLARLGDSDVTELRQAPAVAKPGDSALDYIRGVLLHPADGMRPAPATTRPPTSPERPREPDRSQWDRIVLAQDIELHIRRPLSRIQNRRVEQLIEKARELLKEGE